MRGWVVVLAGLLPGLLAACGTVSEPLGPQPAAPAAPVVTPVPAPLAKPLSVLDGDLKAALGELAATNNGQPPVALPLADYYACIAWLDAELPVLVAAANSALPSAGNGTNVAGAVSALVAGQIALGNGVANGKNLIGTLPPLLAHNCGAAIQQNAQLVIQILAQLGINVALPASGGFLGQIGL